MPPIKPVRGQSSAPNFTGEPRHLTRYFQDLEAIFAAHNIHDFAERFRDAKHYADPSVEDVFEALDLPENPTWEDFKAAAIKMYPGAEDDNRFVEGDLSATVAAFKATTGGTRYTKENIGEYARNFIKIAKFLERHGRIYMPSARKVFLEGFEGEFGKELSLQIGRAHV